MVQDVTIVGLGEALWDLLPSGKRLGGAPLNVACGADQLVRGRGGRGVVASRVGRDDLGDEIVAEIVSRGMPTDYIERDPSHDTGTVHVELERGQPSYQIADDVAWDYLEFTPAWNELAGRATAVCFGTLAQRSPASRSAIWRFLDAAPQAIRMLDVNLRQSFYDHTVLSESCRRATLVKLNKEELPVLARLLDLPVGTRELQLAQLRFRYELQAIVYTRGQRGTMLILGDGVVAPEAVSYPAAPDADAVGAGDACSAAVLAGFALGMAPQRIAELANHMGAYVASQPGATPPLPPEIVNMAAA
jgi:fructokinase